MAVDSSKKASENLMAAVCCHVVRQALKLQSEEKVFQEEENLIFNEYISMYTEL